MSNVSYRTWKEMVAESYWNLLGINMIVFLILRYLQ